MFSLSADNVLRTEKAITDAPYLKGNDIFFDGVAVPDNHYSSEWVCEHLDIDPANLSRIKRLLNINARLVDGRLVFNYPQFKVIAEYCRVHKKLHDEEQRNKAVTAVSANAKDHPLVKDKRCLKLDYWPDTVPVCFADWED